MKFPQISSRSILTQGIAGMLALLLFMLNCILDEPFLPDLWFWGTFGYVLVSLSTMVVLGIQQNNKTTVVGKQCHYCEGSLEIHKYRCKACGKIQ